jgi:hypothetical protein
MPGRGGAAAAGFTATSFKATEEADEFEEDDLDLITSPG